jgi:membrane-bound lytic murein transglycosylase D
MSSDQRPGELLRRIKLGALLVSATLLAACGPEQNHKQVARSPVGVPAPQALPLSSPPEIAGSLGAPTSINGDAVDQFIQQVEKEYESGMADYRAGNLESASEKFDRALALLLQSNYDLAGNERLSAEFNRLVDDINSAELAAVERGGMLAERKYEVPPIESFAGLTFPVDPKVKERVQQEVKSVQSDLPLVSNDYVDGVITYLQNHARHYMQAVIERQGVYGPMISEALKKQGLPQDLIYLAAGESAFNPLALSRKGALGIWQFMLGTGALYGLKKNAWVDDREDPFKSTLAASRHLKDLYQTFGDWFLAMAAYDAGPLVVQRAIEKTGYADYWTLRRLHALPRETENYVPIFLALALIAKDPKAYGFDVAPAPPLQVDRVTVSEPTDLRLVAQLVDHPVDELIRLNPQLQRWTTPANDPNFILNLPARTKEKLEQAIAAIPLDKRIWWRAHKVEAGETLSAIARKYRVSPVTLAQVNQLSAADSLEEGTHVVVPMATGSVGSLQRVHQRGSRSLYHYQVKRGDTLELVADRFDVTAYQIRRWNGLRSSHLSPGRMLKLYAAGAGTRGSSAVRRPARRGKSSRHYVARGKTSIHHTRRASGPATGLRSTTTEPSLRASDKPASADQTLTTSSAK